MTHERKLRFANVYSVLIKEPHTNAKQFVLM